MTSQPTLNGSTADKPTLKMQALDRPSLESIQLTKLNRIFESCASHPLYSATLSKIRQPLQSLDELSQLPLLTKAELVGVGAEDPSRLFTQSRDQYVRFHQTSGSRGWPMPVLDTPSDWRWWIDCWSYVLDAAEVTNQDVAMMAFSFGPFIGFWSANDALVHRETLVIPGGGLSTLARLKTIADQRCTVLCCTPTYALHMAEVAQQHGIDLTENRVSKIIVAGEPGGSVRSVREAIESQWNARVTDHAGASELGAWGFGSADDTGLHVIETEFIAEFLVFDQHGGYQAVTPETSGLSSQPCELVMTNLGRFGGPVIRYRTGDIVEPVWNHSLDCRFVQLRGGVIGRADDMLVIRGVNVFPSSIESIVREFEPNAEFRMVATRQGAMDQLRIEIESEPVPNRWLQLEDLLRERLTLRIPVAIVPPLSLPRSEGKSKRWVDQRTG